MPEQSVIVWDLETVLDFRRRPGCLILGDACSAALFSREIAFLVMRVLMWIKDAECDPVVGITSRVLQHGTR
jgi:hypothetical protein